MLKALLRTDLKFKVRYSRAYLEDLAIDKQAIKRTQLAILEQKRVQAVYNLPANDKNPSNIINVKFNSPIFEVNQSQKYIKKQFWVLQPTPSVVFPQKTITAKRKYIITSIKKAKEALFEIKKKHVLDAINILQQSHKKVAKLLVRTFYNLIDHAKRKGMSPLRLWVHGCLIGKTKRYKHVRYHAKGRGCREKKDFCQVKVILYEKPQRQFFEEIATGECAPGVSTFIRHLLKESNESYENIAKFTNCTSARGKQQAKLIFKRRVHHIMIQNEKNNIYEPKKVIEARLKGQLAEKQKLKYTSLFRNEKSSLTLRQIQFNKNMQEN